ncbi:MAG: helix-turn-helix transcriptional regulator [Methylocystis sp.]|nr:helix-turn-helix transcriptional regulator [Methylocystis sp.]MCA3584827.1 helix-turn-helix transcriptional regulator [Methylocystis sp.]MCA3587526.1 helix-turn-helix transcriptional regulator [Methylocystis sp.]MCA3593022.1 helix-turn-helix transcriptional regulator [Methylocystis sp.]
MAPYLNTEEAAAYLGIRERKLYELVAQGAVPCSKVTGKWLFPRAALDRWIEAGMARPHGFAAEDPPPIIGGSHDPLLEWAARQSGSGLALLSVGSGPGLERLGRNEVAIAAIHLHAPDAEDANPAAVAAMPNLQDAVLIGFARREVGLLVAPGNPLALAGLRDAAATRARFAMRQPGAGAQLLLAKLLAADGLAPQQLLGLTASFATGDDLAFAIRAGEADCGVATRAAAHAFGLGFAPLATESFDLAMRRRTYFGAGVQALLALMRKPEFQRHAEMLGGLDTSGAGAVRLTR